MRCIAEVLTPWIVGVFCQGGQGAWRNVQIFGCCRRVATVLLQTWGLCCQVGVVSGPKDQMGLPYSHHRCCCRSGLLGLDPGYPYPMRCYLWWLLFPVLRARTYRWSRCCVLAPVEVSLKWRWSGYSVCDGRRLGQVVGVPCDYCSTLM